MTNISDVQNAIKSTIHNYQTLAGKTVKNENKTGVVAALERFFHTLEFLLKNGYRPTTNDVDGLPPELCGLQDFLAHKDKDSKDSYILQKDAATRYCFRYSKDSDDRIEVTIEEKQNTPSLYSNYSNYVNTATWKTSSQQSCKTTDLSSILKIKKDYKYFEKDVLQIKKPFSFVEKGTSVNELMTTFHNAAQLVDKKPFVYSVCGEYNVTMSDSAKNAGFTSRDLIWGSSVVDLKRSAAMNLTINGIKIKQDVLAKIIEAIIPDSNVNEVNTTPLTNRVEQIVNILNPSYDETEAAQISSVLQKPQFPLALLAIVCQKVQMLISAVTLNVANTVINFSEFSDTENFNLFSNEYTKLNSSLTSFDIRMDKQNNLHCSVKRLVPYFDSEGKIGAIKTHSHFLVSPDFVGDKSLHDTTTITDKLKNLPTIDTNIAIL